MSARLEALKVTAGRIENVHQLLSLGKFEVQGQAARRIGEALSFMEELHRGIMADLDKTAAEEAAPEPKAKPAPTAPSNVKQFPAKGKKHGKVKAKQNTKPAPKAEPVKAEAAK